MESLPQNDSEKLSPPKTLTDLPADVVNDIGVRLDFASFCSLKKSQSTLHEHLESGKVFPLIRELEIEYFPKLITVIIRDQSHVPYGYVEITYRLKRRGVLVNSKFSERKDLGRSVLLENEDIQKVFFDDFKFMFTGNETGQALLKLTIKKNVGKSFFEEMGSLLAARKKPFEVMNLSITTPVAETIMPIMPHIAAKYLELMGYSVDAPLDFTRFVGTNAWNTAKKRLRLCTCQWPEDPNCLRKFEVIVTTNTLVTREQMYALKDVCIYGKTLLIACFLRDIESIEGDFRQFYLMDGKQYAEYYAVNSDEDRIGAKITLKFSDRLITPHKLTIVKTPVKDFY